MISGKKELVIEVNIFTEVWFIKGHLVEDFEIIIIGNKVVYSKSEIIQ